MSEDSAVEALAAVWATIDGKQADFYRGKIDDAWEEKYGHYEGYMAEAGEMVSRLNARGFQIIPIQSPRNT
jgi:hypothetical protein